VEVSGEFSLVSRIIQIVLIDLVLSADNAVVIGMAAQPLPPRQRRKAILFGGGVAILLRVVLTGVAALLLGLPALKAIGGALLLWIAYRLLEREDEGDAGVRAASTLRAAIATILIADVVMSLDNVLGVAAASNGDIALLIFGLLVSMAIVMLGGGLFADLIDRLWWLAYVGAAVIAWTGSEMIQEDALVSGLAALPLALEISVNVLVTVAVVGLAHYVHRRQPALRRSER
jgi:YjbE family integral membrane protein